MKSAGLQPFKKKSAGLQEVQWGYIFVWSTCRYYMMIRRWNNELKHVHSSLTLAELEGLKPYVCCMIWQSLRPPLLICKWHKKYNAGKKNTGGCFNFTTTTYLQYFNTPTNLRSFMSILDTFFWCVCVCWTWCICS